MAIAVPVPAPAVTPAVLAAAYNVPIVNAGQLNPVGRISQGTLDAAFAAAADFRGACNGQYNLFLNFLRFLDAGAGAGAAAKILALQQLNQGFHCQNLSLPAIPALPQWTAFGAACALAPVADRPFLGEFYASRRPATALADIEEIFHTANQAGFGPAALRVMKSVMQRRGDASGITPMAIVALVRMLATHPPMSGFMGFTQWGPGDHGTPDANLEAHVLKHVCRTPADPEFGVQETISWWRVLRIKLTRTIYLRYADNRVDSAEGCFDGDRPLEGDRLKRFLIYQILGREPRLLNWLKGVALGPYRDFAIENSRVMTNVIVHSNGTRVFISGCQGEAFVIGRFEGAQLGISSCYLPLDMEAKLRGARANMCWPLR